MLNYLLLTALGSCLLLLNLNILRLRLHLLRRNRRRKQRRAEEAKAAARALAAEPAPEREPLEVAEAEPVTVREIAGTMARIVDERAHPAPPAPAPAAAEIAVHDHRSPRDPSAWIDSIGAALADKIIGVCIVGRPVSRRRDDGLTLEVSRLCTDGTPHGRI